MDISIIIVNWKSKDYLRKCIASILATTRDIEYEIIVIDSASFDGSGEMLQHEFPLVRFIQSQENLGFSKANNRAYEESHGDVVLFLNPDTEVVGNAISVLYSSLKKLPKAGMVGGKLLNSDGSIQTSCIQAFPTILNQVLSANALRRLSPRASLWGMAALFDVNADPVQVEMISGACLMMRRAVFEQIGHFSTDYFMYAEDVDLCFKAQKAGFVNYYNGAAEVIHHGGGSSQQAHSNFSSVMMFESLSQFLRKSRGKFYSACYKIISGVAALLRVVTLLILSPFLIVKNGGTRWRLTCSKWWAVFGWGVGLSQWKKPSQPLKISQVA